MNANTQTNDSGEPVVWRTGSVELSRREVLQLLGAGLLVTVTGGPARAQRAPSRRSGAGNVAARLHIAADGTITVMTGKVEVGQGSRAQITQAAAEELHVLPERIRLIMADTSIVPDDGITAGSRTTPSTIPAVRKATATARRMLVDLARKRWELDGGDVQVRDGTVLHAATNRRITYADLAKTSDVEGRC
jgi:isoquinoline 1-oxidoreductase beta subunit